MQASAVYASSPPHPLYQHAYHTVLAVPQDLELKKQYLALLPPQQIIEICLNFDLHVPPYVKSSVWPADIHAAIEAMRKAAPPTADPPATSTSLAAAPVMASLTDPSGIPSTANNSIEQPAEAQPPDKPTPTPNPSASAQLSVKSSLSGVEQTASAPTQQSPYPHQSYGYGQPQAAYPHAPYYQPPPGYPPYPAPYTYGTYPPHPGYPTQPGLPFTTAPLTHPSQQPQDPFNPHPHPSTEDLPSYEEMIAEALLDSNDPEGCAPKDMFAWMASRYPLQSNFRPSASQALQKAFKRGRFHKSSSGKYTINTSWEGGNSSRRPTRRPQTQNPTAATPASPFTHAPLVHHYQATTMTQAYQPGYGYPFQPTQQGYHSFIHQPQPPPQPGAAQPASTIVPTVAASSAEEATRALQTEGAAQDAWEAAQNILKAINFDSLLQLPAEGEKTGEQDKAIAGPSTVPPSSLPVTATASLSGTPAAEAGVDAGTAASAVDYSAGRAELQAHLALLAAQLAELSQEDDDDPIVRYPVVVGSVPPAAASTIPVPSVTPDDTVPAMGSLGPPFPEAGDPALAGLPHPPTQAAPEEEEDSEDEGDMEEVI